MIRPEMGSYPAGMRWKDDACVTRPVDVRAIEWPKPLIVFIGGWAAGAVLMALIERDALWPPGLDALLVAASLGALVVYFVGQRVIHPLLFVVAVSAPLTPLLLQSLTGADFTPMMLVAIAAVLGALARLRNGVLGLALLVGLMVLRAVVGTDAHVHDDTFIWIFGMIAAYDAGFAMQKSLLRAAEYKARQAEAAQRGATEERQRIAREVHDVIAHSLSVTMLNITGARHALDTGDVDVAEGALRDAESIGRQAMADIRRTVGLLAVGDEDGRPMPGARDIAELVRTYAGAGLDVTYAVSGEPKTVPAAVGLGVYRVVQESLANASRHAPGRPARVSLDASGDVLRVVVSNPLVNGSGVRPGAIDVQRGHGLNGIRQRMTALGGAVTVGPQGDRWVVDVRVPVSAS